MSIACMIAKMHVKALRRRRLMGYMCKGVATVEVACDEVHGEGVVCVEEEREPLELRHAREVQCSDNLLRKGKTRHYTFS